MGTRAGDVDPAVLGVIARKEDLSSSEVDTLLNTQSGSALGFRASPMTCANCKLS